MRPHRTLLHACGMYAERIADPLVSIERPTRETPKSQALRLAESLVAAEIMARFEHGLADGFDISAIVRPVLAQLGRAEQDELATSLNGPLADGPQDFLERYFARSGEAQPS